MTVTNIVFVTRKADLPFADFVKYFEEVHMPLTSKTIGADVFPKEWRRHYIDSTQDTLMGENRGIDLVMVMTWEDQAGFDRFVQALMQDEGKNAKILQGSWEHYADGKGESIVRAASTFEV